jgi:sterol desaturase/sphingolipid hydroxylase (fatty acid hydroxylase superfamily)
MSYDITDIIAILIFLNVRGMMRHDDRMIFLIGNHHYLHHLYPNYNFGEYWIDSLCGTLYPKKEERIAGLLYI